MKALKIFGLALLAGLFAAPAHAQDDDDDFLDSILDDDEPEDSIRDEQDAVRRGDVDDRVGVQGEDILKLEAARANEKRVIKTIQKKNFLKQGRFEGVPAIGFVTNDPFLNRYIANFGLGYHITEIFAIEGNFGYSPDLGQVDWKPLTQQLVNENHVSPDISKLTLYGNATFQFSPIYGKVALNSRRLIGFDLFGAFGMGFTQTQDDLEALGTDANDPKASATAVELHPTTNFGGGARVILSPNLAIRLDARSLVYIETVNSTTLEMKNNFILTGGVCFFFPGMDR